MTGPEKKLLDEKIRDSLRKLATLKGLSGKKADEFVVKALQAINEELGKE